jgi:circadian clock protein KaiC
VLGAPGSGKTTLAGQMAFAAARTGGQVLLLTALSEATSKLVSHLRDFSFFEESLLGDLIQVLSLQSALQQGQDATKDAVVEMVRQQKPHLVVLDGFQAVRGSLNDLQHARRFLYELSTTLHTLGVTLLVTSEIHPHDPTFFPESTAADVIVGLHFQVKGGRHVRGLEIIKARKAAPLSGIHTLQLGREGVHVTPRLEERVALEAATSRAAAAAQGAASGEIRAGLGVEGFDQLLSGGLPRATTTLLLGTAGVGKTLLGLHFLLEGIERGEPGLLVSFQETQARLLRLTSPFALGPRLREALQPERGLILLYLPALKLQADVVAEQMLATLERAEARRLVIDGVAVLEQAHARAGEAERAGEWLTALLIALQQRGITSVMTREIPQLFAAGTSFAAGPLAALSDNVLLCQQISLEGQFSRVFSVAKMRFSAFDPEGRAFRIVAPAGVEVLPLDQDTRRFLACTHDPDGAFSRTGPPSQATHATSQEEP